MNIKKILIAVMVLAMIFAFSACGEDSESPDNDATEIEEQDGDGKGDLIEDFDSIDGLWYVDGDLKKESLEITKVGRFTSYTATGEVDKTGYVKYEAEEFDNAVVYWFMLYEDDGEFYMGFGDDESENKTDLYVGNGGEPHYVLMDN